MLRSTVLYFLGAIIYIISISSIVLKRKFTFFQIIFYSILYINILLMIDMLFFPLIIGETNSQLHIYLTPFKGLKRDLFSIIKFISVATPFGLCIPILSINKKPKYTIALSLVCLFSIELIRYLISQTFIYTNRLFDTGIFVLYVIGVILGYSIYYTLKDCFEDLKSDKRKELK